MTTSQMERDKNSALPTMESLGEAGDLAALSKKVEGSLRDASIKLKPISLSGPSPALKGFLKVYSTRLPDPLAPESGEVDYVVAVTHGAWTSERTDEFIAALAPLRLQKGMPLFHVYSTEPPPSEIDFLFGTMLAGVFEIMAWELVEEPTLHSQDCLDLATAGRDLIANLYDVSLLPDDFQWLSVVNQLIDEEFRWFTEDADAKAPEDIDYVPHAALLVLGCVAGEAVRLNHTQELVWTDADGLEWPRLGRLGVTMTLPIIDTVFGRFEVGASADLWEVYEVSFATGRLNPPVSLAGVVNPLDFLPDWDPSPGTILSDAIVAFEKQCEETGLELQAHPPASHPLVAEQVAAYSCYRDDQVYDLFVCTSPWTDELSRAFLQDYGHRSMEDWELGKSPVFVFFSAYPLSDLLEYCFIQGPPIAPLEGLARVETPAPQVPADPNAPDMLGLWLVHALELYTVVGVELDSTSAMPALGFLVREELRHELRAIDGDSADAISFEPMGLLVTIGMAAGTALCNVDEERYSWTHPAGSNWPVIKDAQSGHLIDFVAQARAIHQGDTDEFKFA